MSFISDFVDGFNNLIDPSTWLDFGGDSGGGFNLGSLSSVFSGITGAINSIDSVVSSLSNDIKAFINPITSVVDSVANLGRDIEDKIIGPIINPINATVKEISSLTSTISRLTDQGIQGILQIPKAVSDALTGVAKAWDTSTQQLAAAQGKIASETLVPGITMAVAPGLKTMTEAFLKFSTPGLTDPDRVKMLSLPQDAFVNEVTKLTAAFVESAKQPHEWYEYIAWAAYNVLLQSTQLPAMFEPLTEEARAEARKANPVSLLGIGDLLSMVNKGVLSENDAREEMLKQGYDKVRQSALFEAAAYFPGNTEAKDWFLRGFITEEVYRKLLTHNGLNTDQIDLVVKSTTTLLAPEVMLDMLARGIVDQGAFDDQLRALGYSAEQIKQIISVGLAPPSVTALISARGNLYAAANHWFEGTYGSSLPPDIANASRAARIDVTQTAAMWTSHWSVMPIPMAVNLFFKGLLNRQELQIVVGQNNYPPDMVDMFITNQQETLAPRTIPSLLARGAISETEARDDLAKKGYQQSDIDLLIHDALKKAAASVKAPTAPTTHLSIALVTDAYHEGVIDEAKYRDILKEHGYTQEEIDVTLAVDTYKQHAAEQRDHVATLKAEVSLGIKTPEDVVQELSESGFTTAQIEKALVSMRQTKKTAARLPSLSDMQNMAKKGIITEDDLIAGIQALGYTDPWDARLVALTFSGKASGDGSSPSA